MSEQEAKIERLACEIALSRYGGYYVSREAREEWPEWQHCLTGARVQVELCSRQK